MGWETATRLELNVSGGSIETTTATAAYPYAVYWNDAYSQWFKMTSLDRSGAKTSMIYDQDINETYPDFTFGNMDAVPQMLLIYTTDPGDVSGWPAYTP